jgi:hypothetical protein
MLTGDRGMREVADNMGIEVHGSIWVIDKLISSELISTGKATDKFEPATHPNHRGFFHSFFFRLLLRQVCEERSDEQSCWGYKEKALTTISRLSCFVC